MVALMPILILNHNHTQVRPEMQRQSNRDVLNDVPRQPLKPLTFKYHHSTKSVY
jgi:hypothetical protein